MSKTKQSMTESTCSATKRSGQEAIAGKSQHSASGGDNQHFNDLIIAVLDGVRMYKEHEITSYQYAYLTARLGALLLEEASRSRNAEIKSKRSDDS